MGKNHTAEFKQEAVRVALTSGLTRKQVPADFGVGPRNAAGCHQTKAMRPDRKRELVDGVCSDWRVCLPQDQTCLC